MKSIIGIVATISGFLGFALMGNDPAGATICLMDFDGFPEINLYAFLVFMLSVVVVGAVSERE